MPEGQHTLPHRHTHISYTQAAAGITLLMGNKNRAYQEALYAHHTRTEVAFQTSLFLHVPFLTKFFSTKCSYMR